MRKAINAALGGDLIRGFRRPACSHRVRLLPGKLDRGTVNYGLRSTTHEPLYDINPMTILRRPHAGVIRQGRRWLALVAAPIALLGRLELPSVSAARRTTMRSTSESSGRYQYGINVSKRVVNSVR